MLTGCLGADSSSPRMKDWELHKSNHVKPIGSNIWMFPYGFPLFSPSILWHPYFWKHPSGVGFRVQHHFQYGTFCDGILVPFRLVGGSSQDDRVWLITMVSFRPLSVGLWDRLPYSNIITSIHFFLAPDPQPPPRVETCFRLCGQTSQMRRLT